MIFKLLVLQLLAPNTATTQLLWNVITEEIATGVETSLPSASGYPQYFALSTGAAYIMQLSFQPASDGPCAYFFKADPTTPLSMGNSVASGLSLVSTSVITENKIMFLGGTSGDGILQRHTMSYSTLTSTYSATSWSKPWLISGIEKLVFDYTSSYLYLLQSSSSTVYKWDTVSLPPLLGTSTSIDKSLSAQIYPGGYLLMAGEGTSDIVLLDTASMSVYRTSSGVVKTYTFTVDSDNPSVIFSARSDSSNGVLKLDVQGANYVILASVAGFCKGDLLQFGANPYIGFFRSDLMATPFEIYTKSNLQIVTSTDFTGVGVPNYVEFTFVSGPVLIDTYHLAYQVTQGWNFNSAYLQFEQCSSRDLVTSVCSACSPGYYLDSLSTPNNKCIKSGRGTVDATSSKVRSCQVANCERCPTDISTCTRCVSAPTKNFLLGNTCVVSGPPARFGIDATGDKYLACADPNCMNCQTMNAQCTLCDNGWYLYQGSFSCLQKGNFPAQFGVDSLTNSIKRCSAQYCTNCVDDFASCQTCDNSAGWYRYQSTCLMLTGITSGLGLDTSDKIIKGCTTKGCRNCSLDYSGCTACIETSGYRLYSGKCKIGIEMKLSLVSTIASSLELSIEFAQKLDTELEGQLRTQLEQRAAFVISVQGQQNNRSISSNYITYKKWYREKLLILEIIFLTALEDPTYQVGISLNEMVEWEYSGQEYMVWSTKHQMQVQNNAGSGGLDSFSALTTPGASQTPVGGAIALGVLALDPTGTVFRFTKILQVINKLYFINVNYGAKLELFLVQTAESIKESPEFQVFHSARTRGKLTLRGVPLSTFHSSLFWKSAAYWITWALKIAFLLRRKLWQDNGARKWLLYACYNTNRLHLLVFNLVYADYIWIAPRTLLHSRSLGILASLSTRITTLLLSVDLILLFRDLLETWRWVYLCKVLSPKYVKATLQLEAQPPPVTMDRCLLPPRIDYQKTYRDIDFNVHLMEMFSTTQRLSKETMDSKLVKCLTLGTWVRPIILQLIISSSQDLQKFGLSVFLAQEIARLVATGYAYHKYQHLRSVVTFFMELSQIIFMISFSVLALSFSFNSREEIPSETHQTVGIWIVISSCVIEYTLLIGFLVILAVRYCRERSKLKRLGLKEKPTSFIKYFSRATEGEPSPTMTKASPAKIPKTPVCFSRTHGKPLIKISPLQIPKSMKVANSGLIAQIESAKSTDRTLNESGPSKNFVKVYESPYIKLSAASILSLPDKKDKKSPRPFIVSQRVSLTKAKPLQSY